MRKVLLTFALIATVAMLSNFSFGQGYILVNDDNPGGNKVSGFKVTAAGTITLFNSLKTGGKSICTSHATLGLGRF